MVLIRQGHVFCGFIVAGGKRYTFDLTMSQCSLKTEGFLKVDWRLERDLGESLNCFLRSCHQFKDPEEFYQRFVVFVQKNVITKPNESWLQNPLKTAVLVKSLHQEIEKVGKYIENFDLKTGLVDIVTTDCQLRTHKAVIKLSQNYKNEPITIVTHDLPLNNAGPQYSFNLDSIYSIAEFCEKFSELVTHFQQFWNTVALLDEQCCILDPTNPTFKDTFRRIKINDILSVVVIINPFCPRQRPNIRLLGCQSAINHYENILQKNLEDDLWDNQEDFIFNLSNILEVSIPNKIYVEELMALDSTDAGEQAECAICFTWEMDSTTPKEICENPYCKSIYHTTCLFTYLSSVPRNRNYFGKIQGECPNCNDSISCSVPKLI